ncbi:hypothetical protein ACFTZI_33500 [Streptomyces decoyicus]
MTTTTCSSPRTHAAGARADAAMHPAVSSRTVFRTVSGIVSSDTPAPA